MSETAGEVRVQTLIDRGVDTISGIPGVSRPCLSICDLRRRRIAAGVSRVAHLTRSYPPYTEQAG